MPQNYLSEDFENAKKESIKGEYSVYKPDPILLMRDDMKLTQMRFFEAYLSKINASDPSTYKVRIPLDKVAELANVDLSNRAEVKKMCEDIEHSRFDFKRYRERYEPETIDPSVKVHRDTFPLFDRFMLNETLEGEYFIEVIPGVTMAKMLQKYQKNYATYELQEVYSLSSKTSMRMYSCFKRLQKFVTTKISVELMKSYLGIDENKYKRVSDFAFYVLNPGVEEINEKTDITVTYKPYKKGRGGKIQGWSFTIKPKEKVCVPDDVPEGQTTIDDFIDEEPSSAIAEQTAEGDDFSINDIKAQRFDEFASALPQEAVPFTEAIYDFVSSYIQNTNPDYVNPMKEEYQNLTELMTSIVRAFNKEVYEPAIKSGEIKATGAYSRGKWYNTTIKQRLSNKDFDYLIKSEKGEKEFYMNPTVLKFMQQPSETE